MQIAVEASIPNAIEEFQNLNRALPAHPNQIAIRGGLDEAEGGVLDGRCHGLRGGGRGDGTNIADCGSSARPKLRGR